MSSIRQDLVRNFQVKVTVTNGIEPLANVPLSMKAGEFWLPPALTDSAGIIEFGQDNSYEIDTLSFEYPNYQPLATQLNDGTPKNGTVDLVQN